MIRVGAINSPKRDILAPLRVDDVLEVEVDTSGARPVLVVRHNDNEAGALTFRGYIEIIRCIQDQGVQYQAIITKITGGSYEVRVEPR